MAIGITDNILPSIPGYEVQQWNDFVTDSLIVSVVELSSGKQTKAVIERRDLKREPSGVVVDRAIEECMRVLQAKSEAVQEQETNLVRRMIGLPDGLKYEDEINSEIGAEKLAASRSGRSVDYRNVADRIREMLMMPGSAAAAYKTSNLFMLAPGQYAKIDDGYPMPQVLPQKQPKPKINQSVTARFGNLDIPEKA